MMQGQGIDVHIYTTKHETARTCIDGRAQYPLMSYVRRCGFAVVQRRDGLLVKQWTREHAQMVVCGPQKNSAFGTTIGDHGAGCADPPLQVGHDRNFVGDTWQSGKSVYLPRDVMRRKLISRTCGDITEQLLWEDKYSSFKLSAHMTQESSGRQCAAKVCRFGNHPTSPRENLFLCGGLQRELHVPWHRRNAVRCRICKHTTSQEVQRVFHDDGLKENRALWLTQLLFSTHCCTYFCHLVLFQPNKFRIRCFCPLSETAWSARSCRRQCFCALGLKSTCPPDLRCALRSAPLVRSAQSADARLCSLTRCVHYFMCCMTPLFRSLVAHAFVLAFV